MGDVDIDQKLSEMANGLFRQYWGMICKEREERGRGLAIFVLLRQPLPTGSNCKYTYILEGTDEWTHVTRDHEATLKKYDPQKHVLVSILYETGPGETMGNLFIIDVDKGKIVNSAA